MTTTLSTRYAQAPVAIQTLFHAKSITEIHIGCSSTTVYRILDSAQPVYLKTHARSPHFSFAHEVSILHWLAEQLPVPRVQNYTTDVAYEYLLLSEVPGDNCVDAMARLDSNRLVELLAQGLRQIHQLDIAQCPFDERVEAKLERAKYRVYHALVNEDDFDDERRGMTAHEVYVALRDHQPTEDDFVFTHGDYCLPNILLQGECVSGFIDLDRAGISDRYNDLAIASRSIAYNLGPEYEQRFFLSYGVEHIDDEKIQYFRMMDELF
jgi:kanamycin kinase